MTRCGGGLHPTKLGAVGEMVRCPACDKLVKLRRPFNGCNTGWVQVPQHKRVDAWLDAFGKPHKNYRDALVDFDPENQPQPLFRAGTHD